jgi:hypothetical protein
MREQHGVIMGLKGRAAVLGLLLASVACGGGPRQIGNQALEAKEGELGVAYDAGSRELVLELAPVDLPANSDHHGVQQPEPREAAVGVDGWVHGYTIELLDRNGQPVPQAVVHHVNIIVPGRRELFSQIMQRLGAAGHETGPVKAPRLAGYPLLHTDRVLLTAMLHNPTNTSYEGVRIRVRFPHTRQHAFVRPIRVFPFYLDVMPPAGIHEFDLPAGHSEKSWEGKPAVSGRILGLGGHVHRYATVLRLEDVTQNRVIYEAKPILNEAGDVTGMPQEMKFWKGGIAINREHTYRLTVVYENPTGQMIPGGGMGALGGILLAKRGSVWPTIDPRDPEYQKDVQVTLRLDQHEMASGGAPAHVHTDSTAHSHH